MLHIGRQQVSWRHELAIKTKVPIKYVDDIVAEIFVDNGILIVYGKHQPVKSSTFRTEVYSVVSHDTNGNIFEKCYGNYVDCVAKRSFSCTKSGEKFRYAVESAAHSVTEATLLCLKYRTRNERYDVGAIGKLKS